MHQIALHLHECTLHTTSVVLTILDLRMWIAYSFDNEVLHVSSINLSYQDGLTTTHVKCSAVLSILSNHISKCTFLLKFPLYA